MKAIAAMSRNRVIGREGKLPWYLPEDFHWFKETTLGQGVLMGRKTFASLGRPLPGRLNLVVSHTGRLPEFAAGAENVILVRDLAKFQPTDYPVKEIFVAGGEEIYWQMLPRCHELLLTCVDREVEGDAYFPEFEPIFELVEVIFRTPDFEIRRYANTQLAPTVVAD